MNDKSHVYLGNTLWFLFNADVGELCVASFSKPISSAVVTFPLYQ